MRLHHAVWVGLLVLLGGCCELPFHVSEVPRDAPSFGGTGDRTLTVKVLGPDEPVDHVSVFVFWSDTQRSGTLDLLGLRSAGGQVQAKVPAQTTIHVVAGGEAWTEEWLPDAVASGIDDATFTARVYPTTVQGTFHGTWSPAAASVWAKSGAGPVAWNVTEIGPGATETTQQGFADRLATLQATLTWTNDDRTHADLALGAWHSNRAGLDCTLSDQSDQLLAAGPQTETYNSAQNGYAVGAPCDWFQNVPGHAIRIGPATGQPALMPFGLPYKGNFTMTFGYPVGIEELCNRLNGPYKLVYIDPATGAATGTANVHGDYQDAPAMGPVLILLLLACAGVLRRR